MSYRIDIWDGFNWHELRRIFDSIEEMTDTAAKMFQLEGSTFDQIRLRRVK